MALEGGNPPEPVAKEIGHCDASQFVLAFLLYQPREVK